MKAAAAPWLEPELDADAKRPLQTATTVASGSRAAVVLTEAGQYIAFHDNVGAVGLVMPPDETTWIGFGDGDQMLAADRGGTLRVAESLSEWTVRGRIAGATMWDAAPKVLAASDGTSVWASTDGGKRFSKPFKPTRAIKNVLVRNPATVVIETEAGASSEIWISANGGKSFKQSSLRVAGLRRIGPLIASSAAACPAILSRDNRTWIEPTEDQRSAQASTGDRWKSALQASTVPDNYNPAMTTRATPTFPKVPPASAGKRKISGSDPCARTPTDLGGKAVGILGVLNKSSPCTGLDCLRISASRPLPSTASGFFFLTDGQCSGTRDFLGCADKPTVRQPHWARVKQTSGTISIGALPDGCEPRRLFSARGLGVLVCGGSKQAEIWTATGMRRWVRERVLAVPATAIKSARSASDGTLLLERACAPEASACAVAIRKPLAVADGDAWYELSAAGSLAYRPIVGGRVLVAIERDGDLVLALAASADKIVDLTTPISIEFNVADLAIDPTGRVRVDGRKTDGKPWSAHLSSDGKTIETAPVGSGNFSSETSGLGELIDPPE